LLRGSDELITARTGSEALGLIRKWKPTLVIFSASLHDIDAPQFCRTIRDDQATKATSLLAVLDEDDLEMADLCLAAGCNDVIQKPVDHAELDGKIARLTSIPVRKELRTLVKLELRIARESEGEFLLGHSLNVSKSGMLVQTSHVLAPEVPVTLQFYLHHDPEPLRVESQVVRAEFSGGAPRYGMRFVAMAASHRERLERFIDRLRVARPGGRDS
jgi:uncharacterized protein (TIGR02266 family)